MTLLDGIICLETRLLEHLRTRLSQDEITEFWVKLHWRITRICKTYCSMSVIYFLTGTGKKNICLDPETVPRNRPKVWRTCTKCKLVKTLEIFWTRSRLQRHSVSLAWRLDGEMRRRLILHETKQIYSLNVFYFLLYRRRYFLLVSELI